MVYSVQQIKYEILAYIKEFGGDEHLSSIVFGEQAQVEALCEFLERIAIDINAHHRVTFVKVLGQIARATPNLQDFMALAN